MVISRTTRPAFFCEIVGAPFYFSQKTTHATNPSPDEHTQLLINQLYLSTMDLWVPATMKNAAKRDM